MASRSKFDAIFILGPQGSGKGTQARLLAEKLGFVNWDMGAILREERDFVLKDGQKVSIIDNGTLLSDDQVLEVATERLKRLPSNQGIIFDGIPRRIGQARFVIDLLKKQGRKRFVTIFLDIPYEVSVKRLLLRSEKEKRADDTREGIEYRLKQYREATIPMIDYLRGQSVFLDIDGTPSVPKVEQAIAAALGLDQVA